MIHFLKLIRLPNLLIIVFTQYMVRWCILNPILQNRGYELQMNNVQFFFLSLSTVMMAAAGYIINDYFDTKIDRINKPEKLLLDKFIKRRVAMGAHLVINIIGIGIGTALFYYAGIWQACIIYFFVAGGLWNYSTIFKRKFLIGNIIIALFTAFVPLIAGGFEILLDYKTFSSPDEHFNISDLTKWVLGISIFAFITTLLREIIKDMEDHDGDKEHGCTTLPIVLGIQKTKIVVFGIIAVIVFLLARLQIIQFEAQDMPSFYYFLFSIQLPFVFLAYKIITAKSKMDFHFASIFSKIIMVSGISYLFLFTYLLNQA